MGSNSEGRLGIGDRSIRQSSTPCLVEALSRLSGVHISCGWGHTACVMNNGELYTWGVAEYGALGIPDNESQWFPVRVSFPEKGKYHFTNWC
jgi:alpha-tubulin suppressor-like RCC1 family protein